MQRLAIIGAGDLGAQIAHHANSSELYKPVGFFDDSLPVDTIKHGFPILGRTDTVKKLFEEDLFDVLMIGLGYKHFQLREQLYNNFIDSIPFATIIHRSCYVDETCKIGEGTIVYPGCILDTNVVIEQNVLLNIGCNVAHDTVIGKHSFLSPAVKIAGFVKIGEKVSLGINTTVIDNITISNNIRTGGGAVVTKNLEQPGLYVGLPAQFKKI